jgi:hypothetical protein
MARCGLILRGRSRYDAPQHTFGTWGSQVQILPLRPTMPLSKLLFLASPNQGRQPVDSFVDRLERASPVEGPDSPPSPTRACPSQIAPLSTIVTVAHGIRDEHRCDPLCLHVPVFRRRCAEGVWSRAERMGHGHHRNASSRGDGLGSEGLGPDRPAGAFNGAHRGRTARPVHNPA